MRGLLRLQGMMVGTILIAMSTAAPVGMAAADPPVSSSAPAKTAADSPTPSMTAPAGSPDPARASEPSSSRSSTPAAGQTVTIEVHLLRTESDALELCEAFMQRVVAGQYDEAFRLLRPYFPIAEHKFETLRDETKKQHGLAELQFGKSLGSVFVDAKTIKDVLIKYRFIERYDFEAIHWEFIFYRPEQGWLLNRVGFDDEVESLFQ